MTQWRDEETRIDEWVPGPPFQFVDYVSLPVDACDDLGVPIVSEWRTDNIGWDHYSHRDLEIFSTVRYELLFGDGLPIDYVPPDDPRPPPPLPSPPSRGEVRIRRRWQRIRRHIVVGFPLMGVYDHGFCYSPWIRVPSVPPPGVMISPPLNR